MNARASALTAFLVVASATLASAMLFSPAACACVSAAQLVASAAGISESWDDASGIAPADIEAGLRSNLVGQRPHDLSPFPSQFPGCEPAGSSKQECFVETHKSWLITRGWLITIQRKEDGTITQLSVAASWRLSAA